MFEWQVFVKGVGFIGSVFENTQQLARCAALSKYAEDGCRPTGDLSKHIYFDDDFEVHEV